MVGLKNLAYHKKSENYSSDTEEMEPAIQKEK